MYKIIENIKSVISEMIKKHDVNYLVKSVYLYGSNVESLKRNIKLISNEIDILFVVKSYLKQGEYPLGNLPIEEYFNQLLINNMSVQTISNGIIPPNANKNNFLFDIIGDGIENISSKEPSSIITAYKPRILIYGNDLYQPLESERLTIEIQTTVFKTLAKYIEREFLNRDDIFAKIAKAKNSIFLASLLLEETIKINSRDKIVKIISKMFPDLKNYLKIFYSIQTNPGKYDNNFINQNYNNFKNYYLMHYLKKK